MSKEYWVIAALVISSILLVTVLGEMNRPRESLLLFIAAQAVSWPGTILMVFAGRIASQVRLFPKATDSNFVQAFVFLPAVFVAYYWHYPRNKSRIYQMAYTLAVTSGSTLVHVAVQKYTDLLTYIAISGYGVWLINVSSFYVVRIYADWYFSQLTKVRAGKPQ